jgi:two-component sensor histidine kinase/GAF domain-containing protein
MTAYEQIQQMLASRLGATVSLDEVLITARLSERPVRLPDYQAECAGLTALAQELATAPDNVLQKLCEIALDLCSAHSAGISIEEEVEGVPIFRWRALAGEMAPYLQGMMPRDFAPCGVVVAQNAAQLFSQPVLHYPYVQAVEPYIFEVLLIPFRIEGKPVGTVWVVSSREARQFDREDERVLTSLSQFAAAGYQALLSQEIIQTANRQLTAEVTRHQALLKTLEVERERLAEIFLQAPAFIAVLRGPTHVFERANAPYLTLVGNRAILGKTVRDALPEIQEQGYLELLDEVYRTGKPFVGKERRILLQQADGASVQERFLDFVYQPLRESGGSISGIFVHGVDLTERNEAMAHAVRSETHLRRLLESSPDCIKVLDLEGRLLSMNIPGMCLMEVDDFGTVEGQAWTSFWCGEEQDKAQAALTLARTGERGRFQGYVKNNLQLISALIDIQRGTDTETVPMSEFVRLGTNVRALGVIHDVLTQEAKTDMQEETLSVKTVLKKLLSMLQQTLGRDHQLLYTIGDVRLPGRKVTSLALLTNELFSNAVKHGKGIVEIVFAVKDGKARLEVCDNGAGFPPNFDADTAANTGLSLIEALSSHDLRGGVTYENRTEGGARVTVQFPLSQ